MEAHDRLIESNVVQNDAPYNKEQLMHKQAYVEKKKKPPTVL